MEEEEKAWCINVNSTSLKNLTMKMSTSDPTGNHSIQKADEISDNHTSRSQDGDITLGCYVLDSTWILGAKLGMRRQAAITWQ